LSILAIALVLFGRAAPVAASELSDATQVVRAVVEPATVFVEIDFSAWVYDYYNEGYVGDDAFAVSISCSGFIVNPDGYIITAGHCVDTDAELEEALIDEAAVWAYRNGYYEDKTLSLDTIRQFAFEDYGIISSDGDAGEADREVSVYTGVSVSGIDVGKESRARVIEIRPFDEGDIALLKIEGQDLPALELRDAGIPEVGTEVVSVGFAGSVSDVTDFSLSPSFKDGSVSSRRTIGEGLVTVFETSAAVTNGMSGGPTVDLDGTVIGVVSFGHATENQPFNFITPVSIVEEVLAAQGITNELGATNEIYRDGVAAYFAEDRSQAIELLEEVVATQPGHALAQEYLGKARDLPTPTTVSTTPPVTDTGAEQLESEPSAGFAIGYVLGILLVGALLVGAIIAGIRFLRRRNPVTSETPVPTTGLQKLQMLSELHAKGHLSAEEFDFLKASALSNLDQGEKVTSRAV
jgi:S1-C subfamily serine protease